jgi:hypothetical protein
MYRLFGVLVYATALSLASLPSYGQERTTDGDAETLTDTVAQSQEHVRHIRAHKRPGSASDTDQSDAPPKPNQTVPNQIEAATNKAYKPTAAPIRSHKTMMKAQIVRSKVGVEKASVSRPVPPPAATGPKSSGFFEELFNQD